MNRTYRTPKGTELPLLNLRGREYLEVKYRLVWFREEHPDWAIETELLSVTDQSAYARATIKDANGRTIATSHKFESKKGFPDFIEKAETGSIGRALALIGYGTQFCADELDEGERIVDSPVEAPSGWRAEPMPPILDEQAVGEESIQEGAQVLPGASAAPLNSSASAPKDPGEYRISFGRRYKGMRLKDIPRQDLEGYIEWLEDNAAKKGLPLSEEARFLKVAVGRFLRQPSEAAQGPGGGAAQPKAPPPNQPRPEPSAH